MAKMVRATPSRSRAAGPWDGDFGASGLAVPMVSAAGAGVITAAQNPPSSMPAAQSERCGLTPIATPPKVGNRFVAGYQNPSPAVRPAAAFACRVAALRLNFPRGAPPECATDGAGATRWCNGSTTGFGPVSLGSNPSRVNIQHQVQICGGRTADANSFATCSGSASPATPKRPGERPQSVADCVCHSPPFGSTVVRHR